MLVVDAHLDLAMNAVMWNRDLALSAHETRRIEREEGFTEKGRAAGTVGFPDVRAGEIGLVFATVIARKNHGQNSSIDFRTHEIAFAQAQGQLAYYQELDRQGIIRLIRTQSDLAAWRADWNADPGSAPFGFVLLMEGADPIVAPEQTRLWWDDGLRMIGLAHYGPSAYAFGTGSAGPLTEKGRDLLRVMDELGMMLDVSHLTDESFHEALDRFQGPVLASHSNCRALVPGDRQLNDAMIQRMIERDGVIGAVMDAWMLQPGWVRGETTNEHLTLEAVADQIDHVCQLAGTSRHSAIGSDLDGGYGTEQTPRDVSTIADLQKLGNILLKRKYKPADVDAIFYKNALNFLREALPKG